MRVALFGSFYRGFFVLRELAELQKKGRISLVGVATDDPDCSFVSPGKRVWQYPHSAFERGLVSAEAQTLGHLAYTGRVKTAEFYKKFEEEWRPDICFMATFGQKINQRLFSFPKSGFFNFHPSFDDCWPSYPGGNPFAEMLQDHKPYCVISMHRVDANFDTGELISRSPRLYFPHGVTVTDLHKLTSPDAARLVREYLDSIV